MPVPPRAGEAGWGGRSQRPAFVGWARRFPPRTALIGKRCVPDRDCGGLLRMSPIPCLRTVFGNQV
ncbi:hypothetical protein WT60_25590 [Burkholderia sp. MSMB617WGS]|nr:hypothetical protein WS78_23480 [Burkholderia savannae]AOK50205.1 hypothetical protein WT60_25590 [Burkholderia sp. MSMB617WGS]KVG38243.1 hypothetical protein WS77_21445 [Burkholderia sp. MSMB0265]KVG91843.1 hypothetical protein WS82_13700 [Burkholderia sp. MSMB2041]KVG94280.1 hypothetical protein WS83_07065 [Burkholderia sp. MSMB2042]KVK81786.1 hypothetical protein WS91_10320 [Burkholderia sp. MSMB1498]